MGLKFHQKTKEVFGQIILLIFGAVGLVSLVIFKVSEKIYLFGSILVHKIKTACDCVQMTQFSMHPFIFITLIALGLLIIIFAVFALYKLFKIIAQTKRFVRYYTVRVRAGHSSKLKSVMKYLNLNKDRIVEVSERKSVVFCFGLLRSKICISDSLVKMLRKDELEAVLLHENHHMISREPLKLFIIKYFQSVFFFLPGIKIFIRKYAIYSELAADEEATCNFNNTSKLARALFKISENKQAHEKGLALSFFSSVVSERVNTLSDCNYTPKFKLFSRGFFVGIFTVAVSSAFIFILLADTSKAFEMHNTSSCALTDNHSQADLTCSMNNKPQYCAKNNYNYNQTFSYKDANCGMH